MKKTAAISTTIILSLLLSSCTTADKKDSTASSGGQKLRVAASFYPLADFAKRVGGDLVEVMTIVPSGIEPHDFEPSAKDIAALRWQKVFLINGGGFEPWAEKLKNDLTKSGVTIIDMVSKLNVAPIVGTSEDKGIGVDPHVWLDPILVKVETAIIRDTFISIDPANAATYTSNAAAFIGELEELHQDFQSGLQPCVRRDPIVSHNAFRYLGRRYKLDFIPIAGLSPEEEPSLKRLGELANLARQRQIKYIFFETLASPKLAETLSQEVGAQTLVLNPIEGITEKERTAGENYLSLMRKNLLNLEIANGCNID